MSELNPQDDQFLQSLADRSLPEPTRASSDAILSHAQSRLKEESHLRENRATHLRRSPGAFRKLSYPSLVASIAAAIAVLLVIGVCWFDVSGSDESNSTPSPIHITNDSSTDELDPMAFGDEYGKLAVSSTKQRIDSFWRRDTSWQSFRLTSVVDQRLSTVRERTNQLKKRSDLNDFFDAKPEQDDSGQLYRLEVDRYVWFGIPWPLVDGDV